MFEQVRDIEANSSPGNSTSTAMFGILGQAHWIQRERADSLKKLVIRPIPIDYEEDSKQNNSKKKKKKKKGKPVTQT